MPVSTILVQPSSSNISKCPHLGQSVLLQNKQELFSTNETHFDRL